MGVAQMKGDWRKLKALGMFGTRKRRMSRTGSFPLNVWRAGMGGKSCGTAVWLPRPCVADSEDISVQYKKELCKYENGLGQV